jgi:hypothetical protein
MQNGNRGCLIGIKLKSYGADDADIDYGVPQMPTDREKQLMNEIARLKKLIPKKPLCVVQTVIDWNPNAKELIKKLARAKMISALIEDCVEPSEKEIDDVVLSFQSDDE